MFTILRNLFTKSTPAPAACRCGISPAHGPSVNACVPVARSAGYKVSPMGFIVDKKRGVFFDGVDWLPEPNAKAGKR
jgi:hypothetical protein